MLKKKRGISLLITLTFLLSLLLPMGVALADTTYGDFSGAYNYVTTGEDQLAGQITVTEKDVAKWDTYDVYVKVTLPDGVTYQDKPTATTFGSYIATVPAGIATFEDSANNMLQVKIATASHPVPPAAEAVTFIFNTAASDLKIDSSVSGDVKATVEIMGLTGGSIAWVEEGTATVAKVQAKDVTVTAASAKTVQVGSNKDGADVTLQETFPAALAATEEVFAQIETPNVKFNAATTWTPTRIGLDSAGVGVAVPGTIVAGSNNRLLKVTVTTVSAGLAGKIVLDPKLDVPPSVSGDIQITIYSDKADSKLDSTTVTVAKVGEAAAEITDIKETTGTIYAGHPSKALDAEFTIKGVGGNIPAGKIIELTLSGAKFNAAPQWDGAAGTLYNDDKSAWFELPAADDKIKVDNFDLKAAGDAAEGDITVNVSGTAGVTQDVVIGKVAKPFTVTADSVPQISYNAQAQAAGDLIIKEAAAGTLIKDGLLVKLPDGISFEGTPSKSVTSGNIQLGTLSVDPDTGNLKIPVTSKSGIASTIKISGIKYNVNRLAMDGDVEVKISGYDAGNTPSTCEWADTKTLAKVTNAVVVSEAEELAPATFTIGSTSYNVGDTEQTMDVAPFIENGRTYLPVRYVAYAVGVSEDNIMWDDATATATLIKGDRVVQLTINSNKMLLNGATITMDVPAKMVSGRTMLPIRWVGNALGCQVDWDEATQTVTVTP